MENIKIIRAANHMFKKDVDLIFVSFVQNNSVRTSVLTLYKNSHLITLEHAKNTYSVTTDEGKKLFDWFISQKEQRIKHLVHPFRWDGEVYFFDI